MRTIYVVTQFIIGAAFIAVGGMLLFGCSATTTTGRCAPSYTWQAPAATNASGDVVWRSPFKENGCAPRLAQAR